MGVKLDLSPCGKNIQKVFEERGLKKTFGSVRPQSETRTGKNYTISTFITWHVRRPWRREISCKMLIRKIEAIPGQWALDLEEELGCQNVDWVQTLQHKPVAGSCKQGKATLNYIKNAEFLPPGQTSASPEDLSCSHPCLKCSRMKQRLAIPLLSRQWLAIPYKYDVLRKAAKLLISCLTYCMTL